MDETQLAAIATDMNAARLLADAAGKHASLVTEMNRIVREAADTLVDLDSTTASFEAFKCERPA